MIFFASIKGKVTNLYFYLCNCIEKKLNFLKVECMKHCKNYSLKKHNTFGIDVQCADFYEYEHKSELLEMYEQGVFENRWISVGEGSNLLFLGDLDYTVIHSVCHGCDIEKEGDTVLVRVASGVVWDDFVHWAVERSFGGVENLSLIFGLVGAAPVQNIGAYGVEACDVILSVEVFDTQKGTFFEMPKSLCEFEYRGSIFKKKPHWIVVSVLFELTKKEHVYRLDYGNVREQMHGKELSLDNVRQTIIEIRKSKLPLPSEMGSAGSFFKNPVVQESVYDDIKLRYEDVPFYRVEGGVKIPAAWLISQCGWKGKSVGMAGVYEKQPLILVNRGGATGAEVLNLMEEIQESVRTEFGILLSPEVCIIR
jgi:UDP-N-acetylmuramate dehydrogenase